jgi:type IV secretion system protein TrbF
MTIKKNETDKVKLAYLTSQVAWDERFGDVITRAKNWRTAFLMICVLAFLQTCVLLEEMHRSHVVPFVVAVDSLHRAVGMGLATETSIADPHMIQAQLQQYVVDARSISSDPYILKSHLEQVFDWTLPQCQARGFLVDYIRTLDPFSVAKANTVEVDVRNVNAISPQSFEVDWVETKRDNLGALVSKDEWKGVFQVALYAAKDEAHAAQNPLGIYITDISWSKSAF